MQEEIEAKQHKSKTNGDTSSSSMTSQSAFDDDLRLKIDENERLHKQLYEVELKNRTIEQVIIRKLLFYQKFFETLKGVLIFLEVSRSYSLNVVLSKVFF